MTQTANAVTAPALPSLETALAYAAFGFAIFPVAADCRTPLVPHGCHDATRDPDELRRVWRQGCNLSMATGKPSGVFVLDVDTKTVDGIETLALLEDERGWLPETWESATPSAGRHLFFRQPDRALRNRVNFAPGLDIRTDGGSVALPPSKKPNGAYRWVRPPDSVPLANAPAWLLDLIDPPQPERPPAPPVRTGNLDRAARYVAKAIDDECGELASMPPHTGRNQRLFIAAARLGSLVGGGALHQSHAEDALTRAAFDCGLVREDGQHAVRATIASGIRRGLAAPRTVEFRR